MDNTKRGANPNQGEYLVCIGGWGSTAQIFDPLISECPELQKFEEAQKIELRWQDFACLDSHARRSALRRAFARQLCPGAESEENEILALLQKDGIILAWSLGAMLALELALELTQKFQPQKNEGMENAPKHSGNTKSRLRLILLSGTAAMCRSCEECGPCKGCGCCEHCGPKNSVETERVKESSYPFVPDAALRAMQRKWCANPNAVLRNFAQNCCKDTGAASSQTPQSGEEHPFIALYLRQSAHFLPPKHEKITQAPIKNDPLSGGLNYLLHCDLRAELQSRPLPFPVLLACGRGDAIIPCGQTEALAKLLPKSSLELLNTGHNLLLPPAAGLTEHIAAFLRR